MPDGKPPKPAKGRHQARKRAVDLLFEAEARGLSPTELADVRTALARNQPRRRRRCTRTRVAVARGVTEQPPTSTI